MEKRIELERRGKEPHEISDLNLDNSKAIMIEGLTDEYTALESLSMINVGLTSLKNFPKLGNLKKLELSDNRISGGLTCLQHCPKLNQLNISGNKIKDLEALEPLKTLEDLTHLDLFNNPLSNDETDFRSKVFKMLPNLKYLDGTDVNDEEDEEDDDEAGYEENSSSNLHSGGGKNGAPAGYGEEEEDDDVEDDEDGGEEDDVEEEEEEEDDDEEEEEGPGLAALYNDNIDEEDGEDGDFEEGAEEDDEDIEEEEESEAPGGKRRKVDDDADGAAPAPAADA